MTTGEQKLVDLSKTYLPVLLVLGLGFVVFQIGGFVEKMSSGSTSVDQKIAVVEERRKADLEPLATAVKELRTAVDDIRKTLLDPTSRAIPTDILRWSDLYVFCLELERANSPTFKCPNLIRGRE